MNNTYIFGGYILTGGQLENGSPWQGVNILLARYDADKPTPVSSTIAKAKREDTLVEVLGTLRPGDLVTVYFDERGKVALFNPIKRGGGK